MKIFILTTILLLSISSIIFGQDIGLMMTRTHPLELGMTLEKTRGYFKNDLKKYQILNTRELRRLEIRVYYYLVMISHHKLQQLVL